jgi:uncharacterized membrane protein YfcA
MAAPRVLKLAGVATAAGAFSGSFGVGGGTVIVPLLILWLAYGEREATGTSLAAIVVIALFAVVGQGIYGNVDLAKGGFIAIPAIAGVVVGTTVQQRVSERAIGLLFSAVLVIVAVELLVR